MRVLIDAIRGPGTGARSARGGRSAARTGRRRGRKMPDWLLRRRTAAAVLIAAGVATGAWLWASGWVDRQIAHANDAVLNATAQAGLRIDDVLVEGRTRTERSAILNVLDVARDEPILAFDPHNARSRLEQLPWVRRAAVERRLPGVIYVRLVEYTPFALWQNAGEVVVIDPSGTVIPGARADAFASLPLLVGEDAAEHARELLAMLDSEPELRSRIAAAVRVHGRRWNVRLMGDIDVRLPEHDPAAAWAQLASLQRRHGVLERDVVTIDLRLPDRMVVRTAPGATPLRDRSGTAEDT